MISHDLTWNGVKCVQWVVRETGAGYAFRRSSLRLIDLARVAMSVSVFVFVCSSSVVGGARVRCVGSVLVVLDVPGFVVAWAAQDWLFG